LTAVLSLAVTAPAFAYWDDVHYYLTYYIARVVGYTPAQAYRAAAADLSTDYWETTEPTQMSRMDYLMGAREDAPAKQRPRWMFHAFRDETRFPDAVGLGSGAIPAREGVEQQLAALWDAARSEANRNPGVYLHSVQDLGPHQGFGSAFGHYFDPADPLGSTAKARAAGLALGGSVDWAGHVSLSGGQDVNDRTVEALTLFLSHASPRQRARPFDSRGPAALLAALRLANPAPEPLTAEELPLYIESIKASNGLGPMPTLTPEQQARFAKHAKGPDLSSIVQLVADALARDGVVGESIPSHLEARKAFSFDAEGNVLAEHRDRYVLTGALRVAVQAADGGPQGPVELAILAVPTIPGDEEYRLVEPYTVNVPSTSRWEKIPVGSVVVEVRRNGELLARRTDVQVDRLTQETSVVLDAAPADEQTPSVAAEGGLTRTVYVLKEGYPKLNPSGDPLRNEQKGQGLARLTETALEAGRVVRHYREVHEPSATLHYDCVFEYSIEGTPPATLREGDAFDLRLTGRAAGEKPEGPIGLEASVASNGFRMERAGAAHCRLGLDPYGRDERRATCESTTRLVLAQVGAPMVRVGVGIDAGSLIVWEWERREEPAAGATATPSRPEARSEPATTVSAEEVPAQPASDPTARLGLTARTQPGPDGKPQLLVVALDPGSPLSLLLRPGDILLSVVGRPVSSAADVAALLADKEPHEVVEFIYRRNGKDTWVASRLLPPR
jgi:hypothetical protein